MPPWCIIRLLRRGRERKEEKGWKGKEMGRKRERGIGRK